MYSIGFSLNRLKLFLLIKLTQYFHSPSLTTCASASLTGTG